MAKRLSAILPRTGSTKTATEHNRRTNGGFNHVRQSTIRGPRTQAFFTSSNAPIVAVGQTSASFNPNLPFSSSRYHGQSGVQLGHVSNFLAAMIAVAR
jgi:hypothetical protein